MNDNYINLANAIIIKAYKDYKRALRIIVKTSAHKKDLSESEIKKRRKAFRIKRDVESFFHSPWYRELTDADANIIIQHAKSEVNFNDK